MLFPWAGAAPLFMSERALEKIQNRKTKPATYAMDLNLVGDYWGAPFVHHCESEVVLRRSVGGVRRTGVLSKKTGLLGLKSCGLRAAVRHEGASLDARCAPLQAGTITSDFTTIPVRSY